MEKGMHIDMPVEKDVAKLGDEVRCAKVTKVVECCIYLTVFQGEVVVNSGRRDKVKITKTSLAVCWKASNRGHGGLLAKREIIKCGSHHS